MVLSYTLLLCGGTTSFVACVPVGLLLRRRLGDDGWLIDNLSSLLVFADSDAVSVRRYDRFVLLAKLVLSLASRPFWSQSGPEIFTSSRGPMSTDSIDLMDHSMAVSVSLR